MPSLARVILSSLAAYAVYGLGGAAMLAIPGTPHYRELQQAFVLDWYRNNPNVEAANAAFDEWLRIGRQTSMFFEVLSLTYHSPITINSFTYGLSRGVPQCSLLRPHFTRECTTLTA